MVLNTRGNLVPDAARNAFTVEGQQETFDLAPDGRVVAGVRVMFVTQAGVHASVFVPGSHYSPDNVRAAILAKAHQLDTVQGMRG